MVIYVFAFTLGKPHYEKSEAILKFCETVLRQCAGEISNFFNNASNLLFFGSKHCCFDLDAKMPPFCVFS